MPVKLTKRTVDALQPKDAAYERRDSALTGFLVRVQPTGLRTFWFAYSFNGKRGNRVRLGSYPGLSPDGARAAAKLAVGDLAKGIDPQAKKAAARVQTDRTRLIRLSKFLDNRFQPWAETHFKTHKEQLKRIRSDFKDFLEQPMTALHPIAIERLRQQWKKDGKQPRTINRDLQRIGSVLSRATEWGVLDRHPLKGMKAMKTDRGGRVRFLSADEEKALRKALGDREDRLREERASHNLWLVARHHEPMPERNGDLLDHLKPLVLLALNSGARRGELFSLTWADVDLPAGILTVRASSAKSGQTRRIPLNGEAAALLTRWHDRQEPKPKADAYVFPATDGARLNNINKSWGAVAKAAGLVGFNYHDLRHTFASRLVQKGTDLNTVRALLGHSEIAMTLRYSHLAPDNLRAAVERVAA